MQDKRLCAFVNSMLIGCADRKIYITPLKLQKMLYLCNGLCLSEYGKPILDDLDFEAWQLGPVIRDVYYEFKPFRGNEIMQKALHKGTVYEFADDYDIGHNSVQDAINTYANFSAARLVKLTHERGGAWDKAYKKGKGSIILLDDMKEEFCGHV